MSIKEMQVVQELEFFELHAFSPSAATVGNNNDFYICQCVQNFLENISKYKLHAKNKFLCDNQVLFYKAHFKRGLKVLFTVAVRSYK